MKKLKYLLIISIVFLFGINNVSANELKSLDIEIYIDENGDAEVTEIWDMYVDKGTEVYKPMNLGDRKLTDFTVEDETGRIFTNINWDINKSFSQKKYKNGINYTSDGIELCWGMGSYGKHTYTISYKLSDVVTNYTDAQATLWKLVNDSMDPAPNEVNIEISSYYDLDDTEVWAYGYEGYVYVQNGKIYMEAEDGINKNQYVVLLAKFPTSTFNASRTEDKTFDELYKQSEEGKFDNDELSIFELFIIFIYPVFMIGFVIFTVNLANTQFIGKYNHNGKNKKLKKEANFYRDIPCDNIFRAYLISNIYSMNKNRTDFLGSVLLKWIKEKQIEILVNPNDSETKKKKNYKVDFTKEYMGTNEVEKSLYYMFKEASKDNYLEKNEFEKWCSKHNKKILDWFKNVIKDERQKMVNEGLLTETKEKCFIFFKRKVYVIDDKLRDEGLKLYGLKKFLHEFTLIKERQPIEVKIFEDYLIYAQMFGNAKEVAKQFKKLYPETLENGGNINYYNYTIISNISSSGVSRASSSGGGGGGSFGGGSGGGCR